ncbi:MAG: branched chain amino acid aminotransferase, partial [Asticcacaulis sp.]|nr:branched chain amino acid aminotransferase [Asticcacaulis sp.]
MTGTAAEITPIRSVDDIPVRANGPGKITRRLQALFHGLFNGTTEDRFGWLDPIGAAVPAE